MPAQAGIHAFCHPHRHCAPRDSEGKQPISAARYAIPLGTIRGWEQGVTEPDATAKAYLRAIAGDAEGVAKALTAHEPAE